MKNIPEYLIEPMKYLSHVFSISIRNATASAEDLFHDLVVFYLENKDTKKSQRVATKDEQQIKNYWYICFKRHLLNKYTRAVTERKIREKIRQRFYENSSIKGSKEYFVE